MIIQTPWATFTDNPWDWLYFVLTNRGLWIWIALVVVLVFAERIITWSARRAVKQVNLPKTAANSLLVVVRLIIVLSIVVTALPLLGVIIPAEVATALAASVSTAIALFASFSLSNVIAGIYIFFTRPFAVGDYVTIGLYEGIIEEISINYTTLFSPSKMFVTLPNQTVINSSIINYRLKERVHEGEYLKSIKQEALEKEKAARKKEKSTIKKGFLRRHEVETIATIFKEMKIYGYNLDIGVRTDDYISGKIEANFNRVIKKWKPEFGYTPSFLVWKVDAGSIIFRFIITVDDPTKIIDNRDELIKDLLEAVTPKKS
ncbi:MAG: mechanosensitive ion channel domain-containing protein [Candidatus Freyarchaeum deiterrae]